MYTHPEQSILAGNSLSLGRRDNAAALPAIVISVLLAAILVFAAQGTGPDGPTDVWHGNVARQGR